MTIAPSRSRYASTSGRGLRFDSVPMRLFQKAKKLGVWDPQEIDLSQDRRDWQGFSDVEKDFLLRFLTLFESGEEAVTSDLAPLIIAVARDGQVEEEIYLTSFLWEEAKHCEFFRRWLDEVTGVHEDLGRYLTPAYEKLFYEELSGSMRRLLDEPTRASQVRAAVTYTMVIEGVLAETGYEGFRRSLERNGYMPGLLQGVRLIARDESRHLRYGVYLLNRLVSEDGAMWDVLSERMNEIFPTAMGIINEYWEHYDADNGPFGVTMMEFVDLAGQLFDGRMRVLERDRGKRLADIETAVLADIAAEEPVQT